MPYVISLIIGVIFAVICSQIAMRKGHSPVLWGILGFFFSIISLIIILVLPDRTAPTTIADTPFPPAP